MSSEPDAVYNIYARQLFIRRHGYPLWKPEPETPGNEIRLGDVGFLSNGAFYQIFNATISENDPSQTNGVPEDFEKWTVRPLHIAVMKKAIESALCSRSVSSFSMNGEVTSDINAIGGGIKFRCSQEQGAFLFPHLPADRTQLHPSKRFGKYMLDQIDKWHAFLLSEAIDLDKRREEILFVSGFVKTNDWGIGAFTHSGRSAEVSFQVQLPFFTGTVSGATSHESGGNAEMRTKPGPDRPLSPNSPRRSFASGSAPSLAGTSEAMQTLESHTAPPAEGVAAGPGDAEKKDQCLFLNYYQVRRRFWRPRVMKGAAGPDEREPEDHDGTEDSAVMSEDYLAQAEPGSEPYNPVGILLDYILDYPMEDGSQVEAAIASDTHLYQLFDGDVPMDVREALNKMKPPVMFLDDDRELAALACAEWGTEFDDIEDEVETQVTEKQKHDKNVAGDFSFDPEPEAGSSKIDEDATKHSRPAVRDGATGDVIVVMEEHAGGVTSVACSPDGRFIASGSEDTNIILWDGITGDFITTLTDHQDAVWTITFSPDGRLLASGSGDGVAYIWNIEDIGSCSSTSLGAHNGVVQTMVFSPDGNKLVTSCVDFVLRLWDMRSGGTLLHTLGEHAPEGHTSVVMAAVISPDSKLVGSCAADRTAKIWDAETGSLLHTLSGHTGIVWSLAFSPDSARVVTGSDDTIARVWSVGTGEELVTLREHHGSVWAVAFSPDGKQVLTASNDATIKVCDSFSGERAHAFQRHDTVANAAVFSPDGSLIASSAGDNSVVAWSAVTGKPVATLNGHLDKVTGVIFTPDGDRLVSCSDDGSVRIWTLPEVRQ